MAFGSSEVSAIELAVSVTGQQAVRDLETRLAGVRLEIDFQKAALAGGAQSQKEFLDATQKLVAEQKHLEDAVKAANNALQGTTNSFSTTGRSALALSYALDDLQYGFSAIVNNAPHIALAMGAGPGVAGAMGVAFVAANILIKHLPDLTKEFEHLGRSLDILRDPLRDAGSGLDGLKEKIQALNDIPIKTGDDYEAIRKLTIAFDDATRAAKEWEAAKNKRTPEQQKAFESIQSGINEAGGGRDFEDAMVEIAKRNGTFGKGSDIHGQIAAQQGVVDYYMDPKNAGIANLIGVPRTYQAKQEIARLQGELETEGRAKIGELATFKRTEGGRQELEGIVNDPRNQDVFAKYNIDTMRLGAGIANAAPDRLFAAERAKLKKEQERLANADLDREARDREKRERDADAIRKQNETKARASDRAAVDLNFNLAEEEIKRINDAKKAEDKVAKQGRDAAIRNQREVNRDAERAGLKDERLAPKREKAERELGYAQQFQAATGINDDAAMDAGKKINALADKGVNPAFAFKQVYDQMLRIMLKQQANMDQFIGVNSGAIQQLRMLDAQADRLRAQTNAHQQRQATATPTRNKTFRGRR